MSYLVLARKYRPRTFRELAGQESVARTLQGAISEGRVGHAYLFSGPRGTGKTTVARILAKALNCERGPAVEPCGTCERCRAADAGAELDLVEIDAASNNGVEHVRELREAVTHAPSAARHKVYIVDEVHMLSRPAFNALLKTLEEPPPAVVFLFATTELHKVPETILSRCQLIKLSPLSEARIEARLDEVLQLENVRAEPGVTREIARRARGGMRDALSLADQLLSLAGEEPKLSDLERVGFDGGPALARALLDALERSDRAALLAALGPATAGESEILAGLLEELRGDLNASLCGADAPWLAGSAEERAERAARGRRLGPERIELWMAELLAARERMRALPGLERAVLESALLAAARPELTLPLAELVARLEKLERPASSEPPAPRAVARAEPRPPAPTAPTAPAAARTSAAGPAASVQAAAGGSVGPAGVAAQAPPAPSDPMLRFLDSLRRDAPALAALLQRGRLVSRDARRALVRVDGLQDAERRVLAERGARAACQKAWSQSVGENEALSIDDGAAAAPLADDPFTLRVAELFGGTIEERGA